MRVENRRANTPWTPADDQRLRELARSENHNAASIAAALNRTAAAVSNRTHNLGIRLASSRRKEDPLDGILLNGEPLRFAEVDRPCARCAVRETQHHKHGCGQFAAEVRVRIK